MLSYMLEIKQSPTNRKIIIIPHSETIHPEEIVLEESTNNLCETFKIGLAMCFLLVIILYFVFVAVFVLLPKPK